MFDFLRDLGKSAEEKRHEALSAYLDGSLPAGERQRVETELAADPRLREQLEQMRLLRLQLSALPARRVPRSYALDPARYGNPKPQPAQQLYPVLRGATALTALVFALVVGLNVVGLGFGGSAAPAAEIAVVESVAEEVMPAAAPLADQPYEASEPAAALSAPLGAEAAPNAAEAAVMESAAGIEAEAADTAPTERAAPTDAAATKAPAVVEESAAIPAVAPESAPETAAPAAAAEIQQPTGSTGYGLSTLGLAAVGLGLATLVLAALTLLIRRRLPF